MTAVRKRRSEDSGLTQFSDNVPLANVQEKIRTLGLVETRRYLELAESTQPNNHHDEHQLDLIKGLLEARLGKLTTETMLAGFDEQASERAWSFQQSIVTMRTKKKCSLAGFSEGSLNLQDLEQLLLREDTQIIPMSQELTTEQCETIEQLEKEMSYGQLYNNIEELLLPDQQPHYPLEQDEVHSYSSDESTSFLEDDFYNPRKSVRSKVFHNLVCFTKRVAWRVDRCCWRQKE